MRWETRNKANHKKVAQNRSERRQEKRSKKLRGKLFHQLSFAARVTHCGSNAPKHTHTHTHTGADVYGAHTQYFAASFAANSELFQRRRRQRSAFGMRCETRALLGNVSRVCAVSFALGIYHVWQTWQTPGPAWPSLVWPVQNCQLTSAATPAPPAPSPHAPPLLI